MNAPGAAPSPLSPDQTHLDTDPIAHLSPAQRRVLELLSINTPTNIHDLATLTGHHPNTLREHLNALIHLGLVRTTTSKPHGRGRPPTLYQALPLQNARPETRAYHALTTALVNQLLRTSTNPTHDALTAGKTIGTQIAQKAPHPHPTPTHALTHILTHLGFNPTHTNNTTELGVCPFIHIAKEAPEIICNIHQGLIAGYLTSSGFTHQPHLHRYSNHNPCQITLNPPDTHNPTTA